MNKYDYAPLNTTLAVYETELLDESDFASLLSAPTLEDALNILDKTVYEIPADVADTKNFEGFLGRRLRIIFESLEASILDSRLIGIFSWRYTYHNLKVLTKASAIKENLDHLLAPMGMPIDQLRAFLNTGDGQRLPQTLVESTREIQEILAHDGDLGHIDVIYDRAYLAHIRENSNELDDPQVTETTNMIIDFENLSTLLRAMKQNKSQGFIRGILSDEGAVRIDELVEHASNNNMDGIVDAFLSTTYGGYLERVLLEEDLSFTDPADVGAAIYKAKAIFYRHYSLEPFGPMPVIAYLHFLFNEINNIRLILIGKDNGVPNKTITERMRPIYGI